MLGFVIAISVNFNMSFARILIVDDESLNLDMIQTFLSGENYVLSLFADSLSAWAALQDEHNQYDLVLLDRIMPGIDGIDFLRRIKSTPRLQYLPVILQTAANAPDQVAEGLAAGAYYYLTKPYEPAALLSIVHAAVAGVRQRQQLDRALKHQHLAFGMLQEANFVLSNMDEVAILASLISLLSAEPDTAVIGLSELLCNAVEHGNLDISYSEKTALKLNNSWDAEIARRQQLPEYQGKRVRVKVAVDGEDLQVTITDEGQGFDWHPFLEMSPERAFDPNGRGIALAQMICFRRLQYHSPGNAVTAILKAK